MKKYYVPEDVIFGTWSLKLLIDGDCSNKEIFLLVF